MGYFAHEGGNMNLFASGLSEKVQSIINDLNVLSLTDRIDALNSIRRALHEASPFASEPVDCIEWVPSVAVQANDYNPNSVAPPEMKLLEVSILEDGYTQPIVTFQEDSGAREVVDGFHRNRVGKESKTVRKRVHGYLPVVTINDGRTDKADRMASTIRHNRARGKHRVDAMSEIVIDLKRRNWTDEKIARELGMEQDEVLRLCQITGLAEVFKDREFSQAWEAVTTHEQAEVVEEEIPS
jgi:ParB-like chromosome segregation protein Spo0J